MTWKSLLCCGSNRQKHAEEDAYGDALPQVQQKSENTKKQNQKEKPKKMNTFLLWLSALSLTSPRKTKKDKKSRVSSVNVTSSEPVPSVVEDKFTKPETPKVQIQNNVIARNFPCKEAEILKLVAAMHLDKFTVLQTPEIQIKNNVIAQKFACKEAEMLKLVAVGIVDCAVSRAIQVVHSSDDKQTQDKVSKNELLKFLAKSIVSNSIDRAVNIYQAGLKQ